MKFQIKLALMQDYLKRLNVSIQSVASRVELSGVLISVFDNSIIFEGRNDNLDLKIEESSLTDVKIFETGIALIKANTLNEIVQRMEGETVTFTKIDNNIITIESEGSKFDLNLLDSQNFEQAKYMESSDNELVISQKDFSKSVSKVIFAGNEKHSKFIYQGINFAIDGGVLSTTVCDGIRIASHKTPINFQGMLNKIIPLVVIKELMRILPENGNFTFMFKDNLGMVKTDKYVVQFAIIEGTFPTFDKFYDKSIYNKKLVVNKELLQKSIDKATVLSLTKLDSSRLGLNIEQNEFKLKSNEIEIGSADVSVKEFNFDGESIEISLSPKYLFDVLKISSSETIEIFLNDKNSTILVISEADGLVYLMSPMV